ncbi:MAG: hypothetical protein J0I15_14860 [Herbaspirillum huttiense]|uniref:hypothetical protein n=1 Tax=Herbaspirillum huttiense TaxID=863372 RepID=UPI001AD2C9B6|nr:hypothetical protein [Herbaspirillum huttiense]MBN9357729.1 hypothetical protein [Herbaspirillum huttiense]
MHIHLLQLAPTTVPVAPGFQHVHTPAPDAWGDLLAMRRFFHEQAIDGEACYAFVTTAFLGQTGLDAAGVRSLIEANPQAAAWTFMPHPLEACGQLNLLLQAEQHLEGFAALAKRFLQALGLQLDPLHFVPQWQNNVPHGFIAAKPAFWQTWFDLAERLFQMAEQEPGELRAALQRQAVSGESGRSLLAARLGSLVLGLDQQLRVWHCPPALMPAALPVAAADLAELEALRNAYAASGDAADLQRFSLRSGQLRGAPSRPPAPLAAPLAAASSPSPSLTLAPRALALPDNAAAQAARGELVFGCMTHVPLPVKFPDHVLPIYLGEAQHEGALNLRDLAPQWVPYHPIVAGMLGNFALRNLILRDYPHVKRVGVCLYRKFISRERISGVPAEDNWMMDVVSDKEFARLSLEQMMEPGEQEFLVGKTCGFKVSGRDAGYLSHYAVSHHAEDLLRYAAAATELGVFARSEAELFFNEKTFFMGGIEMGVFPADFWLRTVEQIEAVTWYCVQHYDTRREGYQSRAWAFCAERLGSYLLLRELRARYGDPGYMRFFGQLNLITRGDQTKYVPSH